MTLESEILAKIKPSPEECAEILAKAERLQGLTESYVRDRGIRATVRFVGSVGKGTFLRNPDIDLFLMFDEDVPRDEMERLGLQAGKDLIGGVMMFAEHPYTSGMFEGLDVDMVPCYAVKSATELRTAVDRTPFHADYIISHTDEALRDDIRLMKRFMKGIGTYGAEPDVRGFSGYLCELITIKYGGFEWAIRRASKWKVGMTVFIEEKGEPMKGALVFYDPVDPKRNVASAVHEDTLSKFVAACRAYIAAPDRRFFFPNGRKAKSREELDSEWKDRHTGLVSVSFRRPDIIPENLHAQVWKTQNGLEKKLSQYGFGVIRAEHCEDENEVHIIFELETFTLPLLHMHDGPPVNVDTADKFLERWSDNKYGKPFILDGKWKVISSHPFADAESMILSEAHHSGLGKDLTVENMTVRSQDAVIAEMDALALTQLFDPRMPWEN